MDHEDANLLALYIAEGNLPQINDLVASRFTGVPVLETDSPKQMREFLYTLLDLPSVSSIRRRRMSGRISRFSLAWYLTTRKGGLGTRR
jgi:hypothetical protein